MRLIWPLLVSAALLLAGCAAGPTPSPTAAPPTTAPPPTAAPAPPRAPASTAQALASPTPAPSPEAAVVLALQRDARLVELALGVAEAAAPVDLDQAVGRARASLPIRPAGGEARLVLLSARDYESGAAVLDARPVWLVTFRGALFETDACACEGHPTRPSTAVAVDARDGSVVASFGLGL